MPIGEEMDKRAEEVSTRKSGSFNGYERCLYCGSRLNYAFYFCTVCATPYRGVSEVIPPVAPRRLTEAELIKQKVPNVWVVFWTYVVVIFFIAMLSYALFEEDERQFYALILGSICILFTTIAFEVIFWQSLVVQLKEFRFFLNREVWLCFLLLPVLLVVNYGCQWFFIHVLGQGSLSEWWLYKADVGPVPKFVLVCLIPGITEEIAFRGLIQHWLHTVLRPWRAIVLASALFTALHLSVPSAPYIFLFGLLLGWAKWKSKSLYPSMLMHIVHNWVVLSLFPLLMQ